MNKKIFVTQPSLPPFEEISDLLADIWEKKWVTNKGEYHKKFEKELAEYLGVKYISLCASGTIALMIALKALNIEGEVITTPFSFVATTHVLSWNNLKPVFVDIEPKSFNIDTAKIESAITPNTSAILPVHVYGNPCNVEEITKIAARHRLKVIYDACHTFGVTLKGSSILNFGDLSVLSFHATKVFNTFEGGAIISHDKETKTKIDRLKNFGFVNETTIDGIGINGKMNEFQAALGLLQLKYVDKYIQKRKSIAFQYRKELADIKGIRFHEDFPGVKHCYPYFPIIVDKDIYGKSRDELYLLFKKKNIRTRRYFYPSINQITAYSNLPSAKPENLPVTNMVSEQILCLPIYEGLKRNQVNLICEITRNFKSNDQ